MINNILVPPPGIQECYISITRIGDIKKLYNIGQEKSLKELYGAGTGTTKDEAIRFANYEATERIANSINCQNTIIENYNNLTQKAVDMNKFPENDILEHSFNPSFDRNQVTTWVETVDLINKKIKLIPENYIYLFNNGNYYGDRVTNPISTGAAIHKNFVKALINGIYEVIERDGIAISWLLRRINGNITHLFSEQDDKVFNSSFLGNVEFYDVSTVKNVITVCAHAKSNHSKKAKNVLMFATDINFENIKYKLKKELISVMFSFTQEEMMPENSNITFFTNVDQGGRFMAHYFNDDAFEFFNTINKTEKLNYEKQNFLTDEDELKYLLKILKENKFTVLASDISCREVEEENFKAVKVVIPEMQPISFVYKSRFLATKRLKEFAIPIYGENYISKINHFPLAFS
ncbi:YcaO-like family protein [Staphylococcus sp. GSSP0090]|nr:YcaO-like family protein [Staphylococcus sp. GSSP0090]